MLKTDAAYCACVQNPRSWLKKTVELGRLSLSLSSVQATDAAASLQSEPLLTLAGAHVRPHGSCEEKSFACRPAGCSVLLQSDGDQQ
jgi:hypothetical protein